MKVKSCKTYSKRSIERAVTLDATVYSVSLSSLHGLVLTKYWGKRLHVCRDYKYILVIKNMKGIPKFLY